MLPLFRPQAIREARLVCFAGMPDEAEQPREKKGDEKKNANAILKDLAERNDVLMRRFDALIEKAKGRDREKYKRDKREFEERYTELLQNAEKFRRNERVFNIMTRDLDAVLQRFENQPPQKEEQYDVEKWEKNMTPAEKERIDKIAEKYNTEAFWNKKRGRIGKDPSDPTLNEEYIKRGVREEAQWLDMWEKKNIEKAKQRDAEQEAKNEWLKGPDLERSRLVWRLKGLQEYYKDKGRDAQPSFIRNFTSEDPGWDGVINQFIIDYAMARGKILSEWGYAESSKNRLKSELTDVLTKMDKLTATLPDTHEIEMKLWKERPIYRPTADTAEAARLRKIFSKPETMEFRQTIYAPIGKRLAVKFDGETKWTVMKTVQFWDKSYTGSEYAPYSVQQEPVILGTNREHKIVPNPLTTHWAERSYKVISPKRFTYAFADEKGNVDEKDIRLGSDTLQTDEDRDAEKDKARRYKLLIPSEPFSVKFAGEPKWTMSNHRETTTVEFLDGRKIYPKQALFFGKYGEHAIRYGVPGRFGNNYIEVSSPAPFDIDDTPPQPKKKPEEQKKPEEKKPVEKKTEPSLNDVDRTSGGSMHPGKKEPTETKPDERKKIEPPAPEPEKKNDAPKKVIDSLGTINAGDKKKIEAGLLSIANAGFGFMQLHASDKEGTEFTFGVSKNGKEWQFLGIVEVKSKAKDLIEILESDETRKLIGIKPPTAVPSIGKPVEDPTETKPTKKPETQQGTPGGSLHQDKQGSTNPEKQGSMYHQSSQSSEKKDDDKKDEKKDTKTDQSKNSSLGSSYMKTIETKPPTVAEVVEKPGTKTLHQLMELENPTPKAKYTHFIEDSDTGGFSWARTFIPKAPYQTRIQRALNDLKTANYHWINFIPVPWNEKNPPKEVSVRIRKEEDDSWETLGTVNGKESGEDLALLLEKKIKDILGK